MLVQPPSESVLPSASLVYVPASMPLVEARRLAASKSEVVEVVAPTTVSLLVSRLPIGSNA